MTDRCSVLGHDCSPLVLIIARLSASAGYRVACISLHPMLFRLLPSFGYAGFHTAFRPMASNFPGIGCTHYWLRMHKSKMGLEQGARP
jgi:hypothetical protein